MMEELLILLFQGGGCVNICAKTALQGSQAAAELPLTPRASHRRTNSLKKQMCQFPVLDDDGS